MTTCTNYANYFKLLQEVDRGKITATNADITDINDTYPNHRHTIHIKKIRIRIKSPSFNIKGTTCTLGAKNIDLSLVNHAGYSMLTFENLRNSTPSDIQKIENVITGLIHDYIIVLLSVDATSQIV